MNTQAARLGIPVTQFVKHLILKEIENEEIPAFVASDRLERNTKKALEEYNKAVDAYKFFQTLNEG